MEKDARPAERRVVGAKGKSEAVADDRPGMIGRAGRVQRWQHGHPGLPAKMAGLCGRTPHPCGDDLSMTPNPLNLREIRRNHVSSDSRA